MAQSVTLTNRGCHWVPSPRHLSKKERRDHIRMAAEAAIQEARNALDIIRAEGEEDGDILSEARPAGTGE